MIQDLDIYEENRSWGKFRQFIKNAPATVKILTVQADEATSLQSHKMRSEFWKIIEGKGTVEIDGIIHEVKIGDEFSAPNNIKHRISGGEVPLVVLEISTGTFDEDDITRYEDRYGRE